MTLDDGQSVALVLLYALPVLVAAVRWPWETNTQRLAASATAIAGVGIGAVAWWIDDLSADAEHHWAATFLLVLPIFTGMVILRSEPLIGPLKEIEEKLAKRLARMAWGINGLLVGALMLGIALGPQAAQSAGAGGEAGSGNTASTDTSQSALEAQVLIAH